MNSPSVSTLSASGRINCALLILRIASGIVFLYHGSAILVGAFGRYSHPRRGGGHHHRDAWRNLPRSLAAWIRRQQGRGGVRTYPTSYRLRDIPDRRRHVLSRRAATGIAAEVVVASI